MSEAEKVYQWYHPVLRMDGTEIEFEQSEAGGPCGTWIAQEGESVLEMQLELVNEKIFG